ncbi:MAG TPA: PqqD family protein [Gemmatimonadales bacterium]|nr:PqqD family protein [Gemmatimonadales bacterium]
MARTDVALRRVGSEWVLFDSRSDRAHVLNLTAAVVWTYCDGAHDPDTMAAAIAEATGSTAPEAIRSDIEAVIRRFALEGLLQ